MADVNVKAADTAPAPASDGAAALRVDEATVTDKRGRVLKVRRLSPLLRMRLLKIAGAENSRNLPLLGYYSMAVSLVAIGDEALPFPTKEIQIDALIDRIGDDGLEAIAQAWQDNGWDGSKDGDPDNIKN